MKPPTDVVYAAFLCSSNSESRKNSFLKMNESIMKSAAPRSIITGAEEKMLFWAQEKNVVAMPV
jgi:hypothetical protein